MLMEKSNPMNNFEAATGNPSFMTDTGVFNNMDRIRSVPSGRYLGNPGDSDARVRAKNIGLSLRAIADDANDRLFNKSPMVLYRPPRTPPER